MDVPLCLSGMPSSRQGPPSAAADLIEGSKLGEQVYVWSPPKGSGLGCGIGAGGTVAGMYASCIPDQFCHYHPVK